MFRTHTCGELKKLNEGEKVILSGWVNKKRDLGGLIFIDLRDRYGLTQITINPENTEVIKIGENLHYEYVIKVTGTVKVRDEKNFNKEMATGEIEVIADAMEILSTAEPQPFEIFATDKEEAKEELRLKYRYLDLRRKKLQDNIKFRNDMVQYIHKYMQGRDFLHIDTPILTSSSPEGARDFLVPSRLHPGKFYALPQAPQQFKQLLMVAGFDKYYQIAVCMRDEDPRADRSPGEFYQLDIETSFKTSEEFFAEMEPLFIELTENLTDKKVKDQKLPRIPFKEAMEKYGSDRPDLRFDLLIEDISEWAKKTGFNVFAKADFCRVLKVDAGVNFSRKEIDELETEAKKMGAKGLAWTKYSENKFDGGVAKFFNETELAELKEKLNIEKECLLLFIADDWKISCDALGRVRQVLGKKLNLIDENVIAWAWIVDFPMFEKDPATGKIDFAHNPFSLPQGGIEALNTMDPLDIKADQYDIVANGFELSSGAVRNYDKETMIKAFEIVGYDKEYVEKKFGGMLSAFAFGAPPTCGFAPGIERLCMVLLGEENIRNVIAFPKNNQAEDLMMNAPAEVSPEQLAELGLQVAKKG
jgi:aspartyl-tRNA synthetase